MSRPNCWFLDNSAWNNQLLLFSLFESFRVFKLIFWQLAIQMGIFNQITRWRLWLEWWVIIVPRKICSISCSTFLCNLVFNIACIVFHFVKLIFIQWALILSLILRFRLNVLFLIYIFKAHESYLTFVNFVSTTSYRFNVFVSYNVVRHLIVNGENLLFLLLNLV